MKKKMIASAVLIIVVFGMIFQNLNLTKKEVHAVPSDTLPIIDHGTNNIIVEIKGEVVYPGIYILQQNARMYQLIELAGGFTKSANTQSINMASKIADGMVFLVENLQDTNTPTPQESKVSINSGSLEALMTLPGIGETRAQAIIQYRAQQGPFQNLEDLKKISGISDAIYNNIKALICL